jgi:cysteine desulfurase
MKLPVYMDYHATTPVDPAVVDAMIPYFREKFGNTASRQHEYGWIAEDDVETARSSIASHLGASNKEIIFTSGATESNNLAIKGIAETWRQKGNHIITATTEHKSVIDSCKRLENNGFRVTYLPVGNDGLIDLNRLEDAITPQTILVSIMVANNEIGTIQDIDRIGKICRDRNIFFHTDATQAVGKIPINLKTTNIDLISFSAHKIYGPKGTGVLYIRKSQPKVRLTIQLDGGGHEYGYRSGTLNVPGIIGIAKALDISIAVMDEESVRLRRFRDSMFKEFSEQLDDIFLNGHPVHRLPNNLNVSFLHVDDNALMMSMKDIAVSTGSACSTADPEPSHVLKALGLPPERLHSSIRFGLGRFTTEEEVNYVIDRVLTNVRKLRELSPPYKKQSGKTVHTNILRG